MLTETLFLIGLIGVSYSYFIYPLILTFISKIKKDNRKYLDDNKTNYINKISFIITAYNEEKHIESKITNTLKTKYPLSQLEILVASDGSSDKTNEIVNNYPSDIVKLIDVKDRKGKENAQLRAIQQAKGDILVFSDVTTQIEPEAIHIINKTFADPIVGAISSEDCFVSADGKVAGEGAYVKYEMWLRKLEGKVNTLVGLSGSFFAARKEICENWDISVPSDFNTALNCVKKSHVAISEPTLLGFYPNLKDESKEYERKLRTVIRGIAALFTHIEVLNPFKYGLFAFQIFSHKVMRWLVPWFLILTTYLNTILLSDSILYCIILVPQILLYLAAFIGWLSVKSRNLTAIKIPYFFIQVNIAIAHASIQYLFGKRVTMWKPSKR